MGGCEIEDVCVSWREDRKWDECVDTAGAAGVDGCGPRRVEKALGMPAARRKGPRCGRERKSGKRRIAKIRDDGRRAPSVASYVCHGLVAARRDWNDGSRWRCGMPR